MTKEQELYMWLANSEDGLSVADILAAFPGTNRSTLSSRLTTLKNKGAIANEDGKWYAIQDIFSEEASKKETPAAGQKTDKPTLDKFTGTELLAELKARGYIWERMYVKRYIEYSKI